MAILSIYKKQQFRPDILSLFINPFFIIRKSLHRSIKAEAAKLEGDLLDLGCETKPYEGLFVNATEYIGLDIENEGHSHENEPIDVYYDGKTIPFEDNRFDAIFSSDVFEHVFDIDELIPEIKRVLKPKGKMLVTVPFAWNEHEVPNDYGRYTSFGIKHLLEKHGFKVLNYKKSGHLAAVVGQLIPLYIHELTDTRSKNLNLLRNFLLISPFVILGVIFSSILPRNYSLYFNNIILVEKK